MISSSQGDSSAHWMKNVDEGGSSIDHFFSTMSLSSNVSGNRPPTLSTSSISTLGEEHLSNPQGQGISSGFSGLSLGGAGASSPQFSQIRSHSFSRESPSSYPSQVRGGNDTETHTHSNSECDISIRNGNGDTTVQNSFLLYHHDRDEPLLPSSLSKEALGSDHQNLFNSNGNVPQKLQHEYQSNFLYEANDHPIFPSSLKDSIGTLVEEDHQDMKGSGLLMRNNSQEGHQGPVVRNEEQDFAGSYEPFHNNYRRSSHKDFGASTNGNVSSTILGSNNSEDGGKQISSGRPTIRTAYSLNNMSILKENEEYIENRSRAASVGHNYNNKQKWYSVDNGNFAEDEHVNHCAYPTVDSNPQNMYSTTSRGSQQSYQGGNYYRSKSEVLLHGANQDEFRVMASGHDNHRYASNNIHNPRQRVMSADGIYSRSQYFDEHNGIESIDRRPSATMGNHEGQNHFLPTAQHSNDCLGSVYPNSHQHHNRPRSHSSGARLSGYPMHQKYLPPVLTEDSVVSSDNNTSMKSSSHRYASTHRSNETRGSNDFMFKRSSSYTGSPMQGKSSYIYGVIPTTMNINNSSMLLPHQHEEPGMNAFSSNAHSYNQNKLSAASNIYAVKFKRTQRNFSLGPRIEGDIKMGSYVKVEADRGEDLGIVICRIPGDKIMNTANRSRSNSTSSLPSGSGVADLKNIIRLATHDEILLLERKREEEEELIAICRNKTLQRGLNMNVVDAEYQFDRHKLTFFFEANGRVDFRELVRDLFSIYKTRIWMQQIDKNSNSLDSVVTNERVARNDFRFGSNFDMPTANTFNNMQAGSA